MYGLSSNDIDFVLNKVEKQKDFLYSRYIVNDGVKVQLASFFKNTFINQDRYIAELQHRVWSLVEYAEDKNLVNVFLTLTLPSCWHKQRTSKNGKLIPNYKFANRDIIIYDIETKERPSGYERKIFHHYKTLNKTFFTGRTEWVSFDVEDFTPKKASQELTDMFSKIRKHRSYSELEKSERVYFRVTEPHKDGTPHLHISLWIPKKSVSPFVRAVYRFFPSPLADVATSYIPNDYKLIKNAYKRWDKQNNCFTWFDAYKVNIYDKSFIRLQISDSVAYLMKYIYKTLDDLREDKGMTEISMWYILHGICRFYTSRTLISLNIYRPLNGKFTLLELTKSYENQTITVLIHPETKQPRYIQYNDCVIWAKKDFELKVYESDRFIPDTVGKIRILDVEIDGIEYVILRTGDTLHEKNQYDNEFEDLFNSLPCIKSPDNMKTFELYNYFYSLDIDNLDLSLKHFGHVQNTMVKRGLLDNVEIMPIDSFNTDIGEVI